MSIQDECRFIYKEAFPDDNDIFENLLFENCFDCCKFLKVDEKIVSILFALDCLVTLKDGQKNAIYIFAAATKKSMQNKGYMQKLLTDVIKNIECPIFLRPATDSLIEFYKKFGFSLIKGISGNKEPKLSPDKQFKSLAQKLDIKIDNSEFDFMVYNANIDKVNFLYSMD